MRCQSGLWSITFIISFKLTPPATWFHKKQRENYHMELRVYQCCIAIQSLEGHLASKSVHEACQQDELAALVGIVTISCAVIAAAQTLDSPMKPSLAILIARTLRRKGDAKAALNFLEAYNVPETYVCEKIHLGIELEKAHLQSLISARKSNDLVTSLMEKWTKVFGVTFWDSYPRSIDPSSEGIEEAVFLFPTVLHELNTWKEKDCERELFTSQIVPARSRKTLRAGWRTWSLLLNDWQDISKTNPQRTEPRSLCSK